MVILSILLSLVISLLLIPLVQENIFAPVVAVILVKDFDGILQTANETD